MLDILVHRLVQTGSHLYTLVHKLAHTLVHTLVHPLVQTLVVHLLVRCTLYQVALVAAII